MHEPDAVRRQYASESNLQTRLSVWRPTPAGRDPAGVALEAIVDAAPARMLEVGCGTGAFAARVAATLPELDLVAIDQFERLVELTAVRGITAHVADTQSLPFPDDSFDVVAAMWMLYHVSDLHQGLAEVRRVLRPGGTFAAVAYLHTSQEPVAWDLPHFDGPREYAGHVTVFVAR